MHTLWLNVQFLLNKTLICYARNDLFVTFVQKI